MSGTSEALFGGIAPVGAEPAGGVLRRRCSGGVALEPVEAGEVQIIHQMPSPAALRRRRRAAARAVPRGGKRGTRARAYGGDTTAIAGACRASCGSSASSSTERYAASCSASSQQLARSELAERAGQRPAGVRGSSPQPAAVPSAVHARRGTGQGLSRSWWTRAPPRVGEEARCGGNRLARKPPAPRADTCLISEPPSLRAPGNNDNRFHRSQSETGPRSGPRQTRSAISAAARRAPSAGTGRSSTGRASASASASPIDSGVDVV